MNENNDTPEVKGPDLEELEVEMEPINTDVDAFEAAAKQAAAEAETTAQSDASEEISAADLDIWEDLNTPNQHVTMVSAPQEPTTLHPAQQAFAAMKVGFDEVQAILEHENLEQLTDEQLKTLSVPQQRLLSIVQSLSAVWQTSYHQDAFKSGDWQQTVKHNDTDLGTRRMRMDRVSDPVLRIRSSMGQGTLVQIPLWHTGIWITLRAPSNSELLDLDQRVRMEKSTLGRQTNGMVFSNVEVYTVAAYARFALEHMYSVTYKCETADPVNELLDVIKSTDYPQLMYGLLSAMYPGGYPFRQPCVADPHKCNHTDETILSIPRLSWTDRSRLTAGQKRMMAPRDGQRTAEQLAAYQAEFPFDDRPIKLNSSVTAYLGVPTLAQQIDSGYRWVDGIAEATNKAFGSKLSEVDRYRHVYRSGTMTSLRQYSHWFSRIEIKEKDGLDPTVIDDPIKKDETLEIISEDKTAMKLLDDSILKWIDNCSVTVIGLPKSNCPKCQKPPSKEITDHPHLIPIDVAYVFFTLAALKINQVEVAAGAQ